MQYLAFLLFLVPAINGAAVEKCVWGESYWCSSLNTAQTCGAVQHCTATVWKNQQMKADTSEECQFCQTIIKDVETFIAAKKTEDEISHFLLTACAIIPDSKMADECKTAVEQYTPLIVNLIVSEVSPQTICSLLGLCTGVQDTGKHMPIMLHAPSSQTTVTTQTEPKICKDCKTFMNDIVEQIFSNNTLDQLESMIDELLCSDLGSLRQECNDVAKEFLPMMITYVKQYLDVNAICQGMGFCPLSSDIARSLFDIIKGSPLMDTLKKVESVEVCLLCKTAVFEIRSMIRSAQTQTEIKDFVKKEICPHLRSLKDGCIGVIDQFAQQAFEFLATVLDPDTRCRSFGVCEVRDSVIVRQSTPQQQPKRSVSASTECILCEFVMKEIDSLISDNSTEAEIIAALDKVCYLFPSTVKQSCIDFINTYGQAVISILQTEVTPAEVCTFIGLCKANNVSPVKSELKKVADSNVCVICETVIQYVDALLKENATLQEIESLVKNICSFMPDTMKTECDQMVDQYGELIIQYIIQEYTPQQICSLLKLCNAVGSVKMVNLSAAKPRLVGTSNCSRGPAYWCASPQNAAECGATIHCKAYVWNK